MTNNSTCSFCMHSLKDHEITLGGSDKHGIVQALELHCLTHDISWWFPRPKE